MVGASPRLLMVNSAPFFEPVTVPAVVDQPGKLVPLIEVKSVEKVVVFKPASEGQPATFGQVSAGSNIAIVCQLEQLL